MKAAHIHTISLKVANAPGVLSRIAAVFARRAYNIDSLVVSPALDGKYSRMTITAAGDPGTLVQIIKQCNKLVDVISAYEHDPDLTIEKEMALLKVSVTDKTRVEILQVIQHIHGDTLDLSDNAVIFQLTGNSESIDNSIHMVQKYGIIEMVRTGKVLVTKGIEST
jgi:acetolactate synthase-1/3 small subunit